MKITQIHLALLFAILFVSIGWITPALYASYAPADTYVEVDNFTASDATTTDRSHTISFNRTVHNSNTATVYTELYLIGEDENRLKVDSRTMDQYFEQGDKSVETTFSLPRNIKAGQHRYLMVIEMDLAHGRITRQFEFESEKFKIVESDENKTNI